MQELEKELGVTIFSRSGKGAAPTNDGAEFIPYARQVVQQYDALLEKYGKAGMRKKKFGISTQHYSFAVKSFVEMVKQYDTQEYEFAISHRPFTTAQPPLATAPAAAEDRVAFPLPLSAARLPLATALAAVGLRRMHTAASSRRLLPKRIPHKKRKIPLDESKIACYIY